MNTKKIMPDVRVPRGLETYFSRFITIWHLLFILAILFSSTLCHAQVLTASYYSVASLKSEGTFKYSKGVMANGRQFSDLGLTAACNSFPLGAKVKVTRTDTKASVVVLVTDRTAKRFKGVRIDLSKAAFMRLADCKQGIIKNVIVEAI